MNPHMALSRKAPIINNIVKVIQVFVYYFVYTTDKLRIYCAYHFIFYVVILWSFPLKGYSLSHLINKIL